jgi:hypothetical protein
VRVPVRATLIHGSIIEPDVEVFHLPPKMRSVAREVQRGATGVGEKGTPVITSYYEV